MKLQEFEEIYLRKHWCARIMFIDVTVTAIPFKMKKSPFLTVTFVFLVYISVPSLVLITFCLIRRFSEVLAIWPFGNRDLIAASYDVITFR